MLGGVALISVAWGVAQLSGTETRSRTREAEALAARQFSDRQVEIAFFEKRAAEDTISAADRAELAARYLQRSRETGDFTDVLRADSLARKSIALRSSRNVAAVVTLIASLLEQHRFTEARALAQNLVKDEPSEARYRSMLGEINLEVGDYDGARAMFSSLGPDVVATLNVAPSFARWLEIKGDVQGSRRVLYRMLARADSARHLPRETVAWFHLRVADAEMRHGRLRGAERALRAGRALVPRDHRLLAADARLAALKEEWRRAIALGDSAITIALEPGTVGLIGDAYASLGDSAKAEEYNRTMEVAVVQQPGAYHRAWSLFLLDHDRRIPEVLAKVEEELKTRKDIYGFDLLAWALYKQGRLPESRAAMAKALSQGTQDALLFYHAGMIERASGRPASAGRFLERALEVNPAFEPRHRERARATLDSLRAQLRAATGSREMLPAG